MDLSANTVMMVFAGGSIVACCLLTFSFWAEVQRLLLIQPEYVALLTLYRMPLSPCVYHAAAIAPFFLLMCQWIQKKIHPQSSPGAKGTGGGGGGVKSQEQRYNKAILVNTWRKPV